MMDILYRSNGGPDAARCREPLRPTVISIVSRLNFDTWIDPTPHASLIEYISCTIKRGGADNRTGQYACKEYVRGFISRACRGGHPCRPSWLGLSG
ncbi:hypothetical protein, partial [Tardiphaga sp.]|uniref:hypothetical protein n=1 Tax=Tardiphaga sp. TaxID=1926292 RepID=UPI0037DA5AD4